MNVFGLVTLWWAVMNGTYQSGIDFTFTKGTATRIPGFKNAASAADTRYVKVCFNGKGSMTSM